MAKELGDPALTLVATDGRDRRRAGGHRQSRLRGSGIHRQVLDLIGEHPNGLLEFTYQRLYELLAGHTPENFHGVPPGPAEPRSAR